MKYAAKFGCLLIVLGAAVPAYGQSLEDAAVCGSLTRDGRRGLYLAYPMFSPGETKVKGTGGCGPDSNLCISRVNGINVFDPGAKFYYVPDPVPANEEGVWHVRTQTQALDIDGADLALIRRPAIRTQCSPNALLEISPDGPRVSVDDYIDYHNGRRGAWEFGRYFHFKIQNPPGAQQNCISTASRTMGDLNSIYGFEGVARRDRKLSRYSIMSKAEASTTRYAGLSSEFAYHNPQEVACFGFSGPTLTRSDLAQSDISWRPQATTIWIKRLRGREVTVDMARRVTWRQ
ncbi:hypothetical protein [Tardiphaga robiniae]|uniref:hypothetical protein n=1 Tax=Tardiphaga robiniae TaxID=943830 RepID=UPI001586F2ED|nr:hypothetical protein [Tardiphaga robiniae]NUU41564.1 hypothetical protein [Tardiphaga robiniae]